MNKDIYGTCPLLKHKIEVANSVFLTKKRSQVSLQASRNNHFTIIFNFKIIGIFGILNQSLKLNKLARYIINEYCYFKITQGV